MVAWDAHNVYGVVRIHNTLLGVPISSAGFYRSDEPIKIGDGRKDGNIVRWRNWSIASLGRGYHTYRFESCPDYSN